jgi:hypothetical protein
MKIKRWAVVAATVLLGVAIWAVVSIRNDDSTLSVVVRAVKERMCWPADSSTFCVLKAMEKYEKTGQYDNAIKTGKAWAEKYPDQSANKWIYRYISVLYLKTASNEKEHAEESVKQAILYRDKALSSVSDSAFALQPFEVISESAGDLSTAQRCLQYGNSLKLLTRMQTLANDEKDRLARQFKPDLAERKNIDCLADWIDAAIKRVSSKSSASNCTEAHTG